MVWTILLWVGGVIVAVPLLYLLFMVGATAYFGVLGRRPEGVDVRVSAPPTSKVGENFDIVVTVRDSLGRERKLNNVDVSETYTKGIAIRSIDPNPSESSGSPTLGMHIHRFEETISARAERDITFHCQAIAPGDFRGEVTVYVDSGAFRYISQAIRTVVS